MKVLFKHPRSLGGVDYPKGTHEVPDSEANHWYFLALVQNGDCSVVKDKPQAAAKPPKPAAKPAEAKPAQAEANLADAKVKPESFQDSQPPKAEGSGEEKSKKKLAAEKAAATRARRRAEQKAAQAQG